MQCQRVTHAKYSTNKGPLHLYISVFLYIGIEGKIRYFTCYFVILGRDHRGGHHLLKHPLKIPYGTIAVKAAPVINFYQLVKRTCSLCRMFLIEIKSKNVLKATIVQHTRTRHSFSESNGWTQASFSRSHSFFSLIHFFAKKKHKKHNNWVSCQHNNCSLQHEATIVILQKCLKYNC